MPKTVTTHAGINYPAETKEQVDSALRGLVRLMAVKIENTTPATLDVVCSIRQEQDELLDARLELMQ